MARDMSSNKNDGRTGKAIPGLADLKVDSYVTQCSEAPDPNQPGSTAKTDLPASKLEVQDKKTPEPKPPGAETKIGLGTDEFYRPKRQQSA